MTINIKGVYIMTEYKVIDDDGNKLWYLDDKRHRVDGPAVENVNGDKVLVSR